MKHSSVYRVLDHTADLRIEVRGLNLGVLFENAAFSLFDLMTEIAGVTPFAVRRIQVFGVDVDDLFVAFLRELHGLFSAEQFLLRECLVFEVCSTSVKGMLFGEPLDLRKHILTSEIKAVTYHGARCFMRSGEWRGTVVLDV